MSIYKSKQNDIHIPYFNINNLITFEDINAFKKKNSPSKQIQSQTIERDYKRKKVNKKHMHMLKHAHIHTK